MNVIKTQDRKHNGQRKARRSFRLFPAMPAMPAERRCSCSMCGYRSAFEALRQS